MCHTRTVALKQFQLISDVSNFTCLISVDCLSGPYLSNAASIRMLEIGNLPHLHPWCNLFQLDFKHEKMPTIPSQAASLAKVRDAASFEACISMELRNPEQWTTFVYASRHLELSSSWRTYRIGSTSPSEWIFGSLKIVYSIYSCHLPAVQKKMSPAKSHKPCAKANTLGGQIAVSLSPVIHADIKGSWSTISSLKAMSDSESKRGGTF